MLSTWTDLTIMIYMVPLVISALAVMIFGAATNLASYAGFRCDDCGVKFEDESALNRHLSEISRVRKAEEVRASEFKEVA